jgi:hypothetical protein
VEVENNTRKSLKLNDKGARNAAEIQITNSCIVENCLVLVFNLKACFYTLFDDQK